MVKVSVTIQNGIKYITISTSDSSVSSSSFCTSAVARAPVDVVGAEPAAGVPPPPLTKSRFNNSSLTFFDSRALARSVAQIGSISTFAALVKVMILSA
jgi:hypothetical protein